MAQIPNIKQQAIDNQYFRQVLATGAHTQVVIMSIPVGGDIGTEVSFALLRASTTVKLCPNDCKPYTLG